MGYDIPKSSDQTRLAPPHMPIILGIPQLMAFFTQHNMLHDLQCYECHCHCGCKRDKFFSFGLETTLLTQVILIFFHPSNATKVSSHTLHKNSFN
jgi:hypothetical protein